MPYERRHFVRVSFDAPALLVTNTGTFTVHVLDLSLRGALVKVPEHALLSHEMPGQLTIPLAVAGQEITMKVELAYAEGPKVGLLCRSMDLDSVTHLRRLIELQLGDPALLERDLGELTSAAAGH